MEFLDNKHKEQYTNLLKIVNIAEQNMETKIVMYILAGARGLYPKANKIFNFKENKFNIKTIEQQDISFSSSEEKMVLLALSLWQNKSYVGVADLFMVLDNYNKRIALNAIAMRY